MRKIILFISILLSINLSMADSIKCFHDGNVIYNRKVRNVTLISDTFTFIEKSSNKVVFYNGDCLVKIDP